MPACERPRARAAARYSLRRAWGAPTDIAIATTTTHGPEPGPGPDPGPGPGSEHYFF